MVGVGLEIDGSDRSRPRSNRRGRGRRILRLKGNEDTQDTLNFSFIIFTSLPTNCWFKYIEFNLLNKILIQVLWMKKLQLEKREKFN